MDVPIDGAGGVVVTAVATAEGAAEDEPGLGIPQQHVEEESQTVVKDEGCEYVNAMKTWLLENKRLEDFRFVAREVEQLTSRFRVRQLKSDDDTKKLELTFCGGAIEFRTVHVCRRVAVAASEKDWEEADESTYQKVAVDLWIHVCFGGKREEMPIVEFHGCRSNCGVIDKVMAWVNFEAIQELQTMLIPSIPRPIVFLDLILSLPLGGESAHLVPYRFCVLEDMLAEECWAEGEEENSASETELMEKLQIKAGDEEVQAPASSASNSNAAKQEGGDQSAALPKDRRTSRVKRSKR